MSQAPSSPARALTTHAGKAIQFSQSPPSTKKKPPKAQAAKLSTLQNTLAYLGDFFDDFKMNRSGGWDHGVTMGKEIEQSGNLWSAWIAFARGLGGFIFDKVDDGIVNGSSGKSFGRFVGGTLAEIGGLMPVVSLASRQYKKITPK